MPDIFVNDPEEKKVTKEHEKLEEKLESLKVAPPKAVEKEIKKHHSSIHKLEGHSHSPLSSFCYFPDNIKFIAKDSNERIVLFMRKHPITNVPWIALAILMLFAPMALRIFPIISFLPDNFQFIAVLGWYMLVVAFIFESFLSWFFNVYVVTDERIFDVDFLNLVYREISEANIDHIEDVTVQLGSVVRTVFNYGDIIIQTASEVPRIEFEAVPHPDRVAKVLRELRVEEEQEKIEGRVR